MADVEGLWPQIAISTRSHSREKHLLPPSCPPSLCLSLAKRISADSTELISMKFGIRRESSEKSGKKKISGTLRERLSTLYCS